MQTETSTGLPAIALAIATLAGTWAIVDAYKRSQQRPLPPGPPEKSRIGGNMVDMPRSHQWLRFTEWAKQYGTPQTRDHVTNS